MNLTGASAIVTGGSVRIGREIGRHLAQVGVNVCVHYGRSEKEASEAVEEFRSYGVQATSVSADLSAPVNAAETVFSHANQTLGQIEILINSAAIFESAGIAETTGDLWDRHQNINLKAPFFLTRAFANQLQGNTGAVINIVDWRGSKPVPGHDAYTISKAGLIAQTKLLAQELGPNIRVNGIAPGESEAEFQKKSELNPLKETGSPSDIAEAALYLLLSKFVTGEILSITGGQELL